MFASLSTEVRAPRLMRDLGVSIAFVSALCGVEQTKLSLAFRQLKALDHNDSQKVMPTLLRLSELTEAIAPLQIDLKNAQNARLVMNAFEGKDVEEVRAAVSALFE